MWIPHSSQGQDKDFTPEIHETRSGGIWMELQLKWFTLGGGQGGDRIKPSLDFCKQNLWGWDP